MVLCWFLLTVLNTKKEQLAQYVHGSVLNFLGNMDLSQWL